MLWLKLDLDTILCAGSVPLQRPFQSPRLLWVCMYQQHICKWSDETISFRATEASQEALGDPASLPSRPSCNRAPRSTTTQLFPVKQKEKVVFGWNRSVTVAPVECFHQMDVAQKIDFLLVTVSWNGGIRELFLPTVVLGASFLSGATRKTSQIPTSSSKHPEEFLFCFFSLLDMHAHRKKSPFHRFLCNLLISRLDFPRGQQIPGVWLRCTGQIETFWYICVRISGAGGRSFYFMCQHKQLWPPWNSSTFSKKPTLLFFFLLRS